MPTPLSITHAPKNVAPADGGLVPKGPSALFFIRRSNALADPHRILDVFREIISCWGAVCSCSSGLGGRTYMVAERSVIDKVFRAHDTFAKYPYRTSDLAKLQALIGKGMLATHTDEEWASHRQSMARAFSKTATLKNFAVIVQRNVTMLLDEAKKRGSHLCNISELAMRLSGRVMSDILAPNHPFADENFLQIKRLLDVSILDFHRWDFKRRARPYKTALREQAALLIRTAAADPHGHGLLQRMMADEPNWRTDRAAGERLLDRTINLIVAGYETTATTLNWVLYLLASYPSLQDSLRSEVDEDIYGDGTAFQLLHESTLLCRVIAEAMRLYTVLWFNVRYAIQDATIENHRFVKGARVMLLPFLANRSSKVYSKPDVFDPDRYLAGEPRPIFPFGNGPRVCIGRALAELEMQTFIAMLIQHFRLVAVDMPKAIGGVLLQPDRDVRIHLTPL